MWQCSWHEKVALCKDFPVRLKLIEGKKSGIIVLYGELSGICSSRLGNLKRQLIEWEMDSEKGNQT